jgi:hypothetical protein
VAVVNAAGHSGDSHAAPGWLQLPTQGLTGSDFGLGTPQLLGGDDARSLLGVAETKFDLDEPILAKVRAHRQRHARVDDLEMRHLDALAATRDLAPSRECGGAKLNAERSTGLSGRDNDDGSLNLKHRNLLDDQT